ncbi:Chemotaxis protein CheA [Sulfitobacter sp. THAF37]|uniref:chemotaxis protein CheA n=1 Tax=Sulfitobacter sp. THAF37 TaxID=2587855 RepID=UPI0012682163|nr:chemotaxis protein CheA [Sulfitobacter sp. THAF37]QFT59963.1 Chemotaxis protein CheA [Sulfitobacter sp. THAF37]
MSDQNDPMAEIRASFFIECEELLEALQDGLQIMADGADDKETINIVFRAVHSIKGGAGAFGLEFLVRFAHRYETVLDEVRAGRLNVTPEALKVFYQAADHLSDLVRASRDGLSEPKSQTDALLAALNGFLGDEGPADEPQPEEEIDFQPMGLSLDLDLGDAENGLPDLTSAQGVVAAMNRYTIRFAPAAELFETGNDPAILLRNLSALGHMEVHCDTADVPPLEKLAPEVPHLAWRITLETEADDREIASVFEFVEGLCHLEIDSEADRRAPIAPEPPEHPAEPAQEVSDFHTVEVEATPAPEDPVPEPPAPSAAIEGMPQPMAPSAAPKPAAAAPAPAPKTIVRVDLDRIERLVNLVGELVINQAMLSQSLEHSGLSPHSDAMNGLEEFQRLTRDIQDSVMMIRAQPVKSLFQRMSRIVREASSAVDKDVRLIVQGEDTEVDKTVIERLSDPLTHMIRNAVDHGLESRADRAAAGKPEQGQVHLTAAHRSGRVVIEIADDGAGINRSKVQQLAIQKGLIPPDAVLSDSEIDNLLFMPGFSTAEKVSNLSGRGVGMDVVRTAIQALGGRITTTSQPGEGTTFSISLPLTLAVLDGMVVEVAGETLVLPLNVVVETLTLGANDVQMLRPGRNVVRVRSGFVPLLDLGGALGYRAPLEDFTGCVVLLIGQEDGTTAALLIDNIVDQRQVVIKGLDESFHRAPGIAAATILGDGQIALILDPSDIISNAMSAHLAMAALPRTEGATA